MNLTLDGFQSQVLQIVGIIDINVFFFLFLGNVIIHGPAGTTDL